MPLLLGVVVDRVMVGSASTALDGIAWLVFVLVALEFLVFWARAWLQTHLSTLTSARRGGCPANVPFAINNEVRVQRTLLHA